MFKTKYLVVLTQSKSRLWCKNIRKGKEIYFTTSDYDKFGNNTLDVKITKKKLVTEFD